MADCRSLLPPLEFAFGVNAIRLQVSLHGGCLLRMLHLTFLYYVLRICWVQSPVWVLGVGRGGTCFTMLPW